MESRQNDATRHMVAVLNRAHLPLDTGRLRNAVHIATDSKRQVDLFVWLNNGREALNVVACESLHGLNFDRRWPFSRNFFFAAPCDKSGGKHRDDCNVNFHDYSSPNDFAKSALAVQYESNAS